jgi:uncharacterized protein with HEPN domain
MTKYAIPGCGFMVDKNTQMLDDDYTTVHDDIPWHKMRGLRNRIVHDYEGIDLSLIWDIISGDLPNLTKRLSGICDK